MIIFYRHKECAFCDEVHEQLKELVVAHTIIRMPESADADAHYLSEKEKKYRGQTVIQIYLEELKRFLYDWRRFQSDSCYTGDDDQLC